MKYSVFICDDDQRQVEQIAKIVSMSEEILSDEEKINFQIASANNYQDAVTYLNQNQINGGIYFLDIELGKDTQTDTGFDLAAMIKKQDERAQVIFITSHADLSIITYQRRLGPIDYIVKTPDLDKLKQRIVKTIEVAIYNLHKFNYMKEMTFSYKVGRRVFNVNLDDVIYISTTSIPHKLLLIEKNGTAQFLGSINQYAKENPMLEKIDQSCVANPKNIKAIDLHNHRVMFVNGDVEDYSRSSNKRMREFLNKYNYKTEVLNQQEEKTSI